jgi:hypothetical protein
MTRRDAVDLLHNINSHKKIDYYTTYELINHICKEYEESLKILQCKLDYQEILIKELEEYKFMYEDLSK